jgi:hypothetical protein
MMAALGVALRPSRWRTCPRMALWIVSQVPALRHWLFSGFLDGIAGYGYQPQRSVHTYLVVLAVLTGLFLLASHGVLTFGLPPSQLDDLTWYEALIVSVSSFHERGFFQWLQSAGDPIAILAALEAVFGLIIEISFIATITQRFFGR